MDNKMEKIVSLAKRRGFIYPGSEIYGGLAGTWDYGPLGVALKNNIKNLWWKQFVLDRDDMYPIDAAILMNSKTWEASGHTGAGFADPLVECKKCHKRFRADHLKSSDFNGKEVGLRCPECAGELTEEKQFNMMFETYSGSVRDTASLVYLRPETAQGMFVNFKNIIDSFHPKLPFGLAQIGKAFRNEITPKDFIFRSREFEQMEIEYFIKEEEWEKQFEYWRKEMHKWMEKIGLDAGNLHELEVPKSNLAHYSKRTIDFEYNFSFGKDELYGLAYRTDFDLKNHKLDYYDEETKERFVPHVIEPTFGIDRTVLAILTEAYTEDDPLAGGEEEKRVYMKFKPKIAPVKVAVFPLLKNKPELVRKAREVYEEIRKDQLNGKAGIPQTVFDDNGNIGKRYRRQDEIGTPFCVTIDFETLDDDTVTLRSRDTGEQERVKITDLTSTLKSAIL